MTRKPSLGLRPPGQEDHLPLLPSRVLQVWSGRVTVRIRNATTRDDTDIELLRLRPEKCHKCPQVL